jgi:hypothetical protein
MDKPTRLDTLCDDLVFQIALCLTLDDLLSFSTVRLLYVSSSTTHTGPSHVRKFIRFCAAPTRGSIGWMYYLLRLLTQVAPLARTAATRLSALPLPVLDTFGMRFLGDQAP